MINLIINEIKFKMVKYQLIKIKNQIQISKINMLRTIDEHIIFILKL